MSLKFGPGVRLRSRREYVAVQQRGRRVAARYLTMLALPNTLGRNRLGLIASRRLGGAVERNRAKRRIRDLFRRTGPDQLEAGRVGLDLVVIPKRELLEASAPDLAADFRSAFGRVRPRGRS